MTATVSMYTATPAVLGKPSLVQPFTLSGTASNSNAATASGLVRIAVGVAARIEIGAGAVATSNSEYWPIGVEVRVLAAGERVSLIAAA